MAEIKQLDSKIVYQNKWMSVREDRILRPSGAEVIYGVVESRPAELPRQPLAERYVNLSIHTAPIGQVNTIILNQFDRKLATLQDNVPH